MLDLTASSDRDAVTIDMTPASFEYRRVLPRTLTPMPAGSSFKDWVGDRQVALPSTNAGAQHLPFQRWHRFKEAFSPELIAQAVQASPRPVRRLADPFGGSGTSALSAQFLAIEPVTVEVNPFLADLIAAKVAEYHVPSLITALARVTRVARASRSRGRDLVTTLPPTFVEPGLKGRWLFDAVVVAEIAKIRAAIEAEEDPIVMRLFRVLLGGLMVGFSNATVSGKGRRYRVNWEERRVDPACVLPTFADATASAIVEIDAYATRPIRHATVICGDSRTAFAQVDPVDLIVCSPPYPNSFDYTDVYNLELWMLGYLTSFAENRALRQSTLSSHVQVSRDFAPAPRTPTLDRTMRALRRAAVELWDSRLPQMVGAYFADLEILLKASAKLLPKGGQAWFVVGDSQYAGVHVRVAKILAELAPSAGFRVERSCPFRSMRVSPQQSGRPKLSEDLLVLTRK